MTYGLLWDSCTDIVQLLDDMSLICFLLQTALLEGGLPHRANIASCVHDTPYKKLPPKPSVSAIQAAGQSCVRITTCRGGHFNVIVTQCVQCHWHTCDGQHHH